MQDSTRKILLALSAGGLAGMAAWFIMRPIVQSQIEKSITDELHRQIPAQLTQQLDARLAQYGITADTITALSRLLTLFGNVLPPVPASAGTAGLGRITLRPGETWEQAEARYRRDVLPYLRRRA